MVSAATPPAPKPVGSASQSGQQSDPVARSIPSIPIVDLGAAGDDREQRQDLAARLTEICHQIGFLIVTNHGIDTRLVDAVFADAGRLFDLPEEQKRRIDKTLSPHFRGWEAVGTEFTNGRQDIREQLDLWSEHPVCSQSNAPHYMRLLGPNQWLSEASLPGFRGRMNEWFIRMAPLADDILSLLCMGLGLPEDYLERRFGGQCMSLTKLIRYPQTPAGQFGVNAHHDTGFITLLATGPVAGLQIQMADQSWVDVPYVAGGLVVNLGEMLQAMTGQYLLATPHRVATNQPRISLGYFHGPSLQMRLDPMPLADNYVARVAASARHRDAGYMAPRSELSVGVDDMRSGNHAQVYGEQLWNYFERSYPDHVRRHYG